MARLFRLALESSDLEGSVAGGGETLNETELEQNTEETVQEQNEVENESQEVGEALEEADVLAEQAEVNNELLENPEATVTAADVEISEEALKLSCYKLGITRYNKLSFANEAYAADIRSNPRKYLKVSNEAISDTLKKIFLAIKNMIKQIITKIKRLYIKISAKFANYSEQLKEKLDKISSLNVASVDAAKLKDALKDGGCNLQYALLRNAPLLSLVPSNDIIGVYKSIINFVSQFKDFSAIAKNAIEKGKNADFSEEPKIEAMIKNIKNLPQILSLSDDDIVGACGYQKTSTYKDSSDSNMQVNFKDTSGLDSAVSLNIIYNNKLAYFYPKKMEIRFAVLEVDNSKLSSAAVKPDLLIKMMLKLRQYPEGLAKNIKFVCDTFANVENTAMKTLDAVEAGSKLITESEGIRVGIRAIKSAAIDFGMFILNTSISQMKDYIRILNLVIANSNAK